MCASAAAPGRGTELIGSGRITGWMCRFRCAGKVCGSFGMPRWNAEYSLHSLYRRGTPLAIQRGVGLAVFCSCYLPSRLYCRHRIFTGSAVCLLGCSVVRCRISRINSWTVNASRSMRAKRFAGCDRRFGISPTPEHDDAFDYATARTGHIFSRRRNKFRDKMTFFDAL